MGRTQLPYQNILLTLILNLVHLGNSGNITIESAGDDIYIGISPYSDVERGGLAFAVLNQNNGNQTYIKMFPLERYHAYWWDLEWHISQVTPGNLILLSITTARVAGGLRDAVFMLERLGSTMVTHLTPDACWMWVFIKNGKTLLESTNINNQCQLHVDTSFYLDSNLSKNNLNEITLKQRKLCQNHGVLSDLCGYDNFNPIQFRSTGKVVNQKALSNIPIIITAGARYPYLYHSLKAILKAPGAIKENILVILGDTNEATVMLLEVLDVRFTYAWQNTSINNIENLNFSNSDEKKWWTNNRLYLYYRKAFEIAASTYPNAPAVIFLDEDARVSPDFFSFMSQTLWLLYEDPSIYCITGFAHLGWKGLAHHPSKIQRGRIQVEWGYAITNSFIKEALSLWPEKPDNYNLIYDFWLYQYVSGNRECVFPEYSRIHHYGVGVNSIPDMVEQIYQPMPVVEQANIPLANVHNILYSNWKTELTKNITNAVPLEGNPCSEDFLPSPDKATRYSFFYKLDGKPNGKVDEYQYYESVFCMGTWGFTEQGHHEGVTILSPSNHVTLYMIGVPFSSYSYLCPKNISLWDIDKISTETFDANQDRIEQISLHSINMINKNITSDNLIDLLLV